MLYFADGRWWQWHKDRPAFQAFAGVKASIFSTGSEIDDAAVYMLRNANERDQDPGGVSDDPGALKTGYNSGYQAINLALLAGARRLVLLGYDMKAESSRRSHWFGDHPAVTDPLVFKSMVPHFRRLAVILAGRGIEVINCSAATALDCFRRATIESVFPDPAGPALPA